MMLLKGFAADPFHPLYWAERIGGDLDTAVAEAALSYLHDTQITYDVWNIVADLATDVHHAPVHQPPNIPTELFK